MGPWRSTRHTPLADIVKLSLTPAAAVAYMIDFETANHLDVPALYISTAITSAGHRREPDLTPIEGIPEAVRRNNRTCALMMEALTNDQPHLVTSENVMVPTDLGHVPTWHDTDYLQFYFAWMAGLSAAGAEAYSRSLSDPVYAPLIDAANDRRRLNDERWPHYRVFTEIAIAKLESAAGIAGGLRSDGCSMLLQLVDVALSLGCRAENLFAEARELDVLAPTFGSTMPRDLASDIDVLIGLGANVGAQRKPVEIVPIILRR